MPSLTRAWQMLLKGLFEVRDATRPISACEMALIRLAYAADLPPTDKLVRDVLDGGAHPRAVRRRRRPRPRAGRRFRRVGCAASCTGRTAVPEGAPGLARAGRHCRAGPGQHAPVLKVHIENDMHLVRLEPGRSNFAQAPRAPRTLAGDLQQKLRDWTGTRWSVSIANEGGAPTFAEQKKSAQAARFESVMQEPMVRAVLDRFPGAEIVAVRDSSKTPPAEPPEQHVR